MALVAMMDEDDHIRANIRKTLNETYLDFYRWIPDQPRSRRLPEYIEVESRQAFKSQSACRFKGMVGQAAYWKKKKRDEERLKKEEEERKLQEARGRGSGPGGQMDQDDSEEDNDDTIDEDATMEDVRVPTNDKQEPALVYDGACPFWIDPDIPAMKLLLQEPDPEPPSITGPSHPDVKKEKKAFAPTSEPKSCWQTTSRHPGSLQPYRREVKTFHRPGFMEPLTGSDYLPRSAFEAVRIQDTTPARSIRPNSIGSSSVPNAITFRPLRKHAVDLSQYGTTVEPARSYAFCNPITAAIYVAEQPVMQFYPIFPDDTVLAFGETDYEEVYEKRYAWEAEDRDPDIDIILIEVLVRLRRWAKKHPRRAHWVSCEHIQGTGILPQNVEVIRHWNHYRDVFPFPVAVNDRSQDSSLEPRSQRGTPSTNATDSEIREIEHMVGMYSDLRAMLARSNPKHLEAGPSLAEETLTARLLEIKRSSSGSKRDTPPVGNSKRRSKRRRALTDDEIRQLRELFIRPVENERVTQPTDEELAAEHEKEEGMFSMMRNQQELLCPNGSCREYACPFHIGDAARSAIPYSRLPILNLGDRALLKTILLQPERVSANVCPCSDECFLAPRSADAQPSEEMREADMHLLQTFLYGLCSRDLDTEEMLDTRVCDLVDIFGPSAGPAGKGWSCLQLGLHVRRIVDRESGSSALNPSSNTADAVIFHAGNVNVQDTLPDQVEAKRSKQIQKQIMQLTGKERPRPFSPMAGANEPTPVVERDFSESVPNDMALCSHEGPCSSADCECFRKRNNCGRECRCPPSCRRRHKGCRCYEPASGKDRVCGTDKCPCFRAGRECDPDLCGSCGAREAVESALRPADECAVKQVRGRTWRKGSCRNVGLRSGEFQPVRVDYSSTHGYGLFAKVDISKGALIIEYIGEMVDEFEGHKREKTYEPLGVNYLFGLHKEMMLDSHRRGNISRFINHPSNGAEANCGSEVKLVHGNHRIQLRAKRSIRQGEEILMDYGKQFNHKVQKHAQTIKDKEAVAEKAALATPSKRNGKHTSIPDSVRKQGSMSNTARKQPEASTSRRPPGAGNPEGRERGTGSPSTRVSIDRAGSLSKRRPGASSEPQSARPDHVNQTTPAPTGLLVNYTLDDLRGDDDDGPPDEDLQQSDDSDHSLYVGETVSSRKRRRIFHLADLERRPSRR